MTDISIIIVNYNVKDLVDNCISSVYKASSGKYAIEIFFVDNYSVDGSFEFISSKYPDVICIKNSQNLGFSKANNIALKKAKGNYILILNPDTVLEEGTFDKIINFIESNENVGAVTSKLILGNGELDKACKRSFPTLSAAFPRIVGLSALFPNSKVFGKYNLTYLDENKTHEVDSICGAFMFIPKKVLDETGCFDEDYFMYGEDIDLCYRIKKEGYKILNIPSIASIHLGQTDNLREFFKKEMWRGNALIKGIKNHGILKEELSSTIITLYHFFTILFCIIQNGPCYIYLFN